MKLPFFKLRIVRYWQLHLVQSNTSFQLFRPKAWNQDPWPFSFSNILHPIYQEILLALPSNISRIFLSPPLPSYHHYYNCFPTGFPSSTPEFTQIEACDPFKPQITSCLPTVQSPSRTSHSTLCQTKAITGFPGPRGAAPSRFSHSFLATFLLFLKYNRHLLPQSLCACHSLRLQHFSPR